MKTKILISFLFALFATGLCIACLILFWTIVPENVETWIRIWFSILTIAGALAYGNFTILELKRLRKVYTS